MIIHDSKIVFIHIPKTGGTTIEHMLETNKSVGTPDSSFGAHHRLDQVFKKYAEPRDDDPEFEPLDIGSYSMFTVARNPWERYASLYIHDMLAFKNMPKNKKRDFVDVDEYMETRVSENFFKMIEVDGVIPDSFMIINFGDFRNEIKRVFGAMGLKPGRVWHDNKKTNPQKKAAQEVLKMQSFQDAVAKMCAKEIELFAYEVPEC